MSTAQNTQPQDQQAATNVLLHPLAQTPEELLSNEQAELDYCSAIIRDPDTIIVTKGDVSPKEFVHPLPQAIIKAAWACLDYEPPMPVTRATLKDRLEAAGNHHAVKHLRKLDDACTDEILRAAKTNAGIVRKLWKARKIRDSSLRLAEKAEKDPDKVDEYVTKNATYQMDLIAQSGINQRDPSVKAILERMPEEIVEGKPWGFAWLDMLTKGRRGAELYGVLGRIKARKTTLVAGMMLEPLDKGASVSWYTMDGTQQQCANRFIAMLATHRLWQMRVPMEQWTLDILGIAKKYRTPEQHEAIMWAQERLAGYNFRIYDGKDKIRDLSEMERLLYRDIHMHGCEIFVYDFIQRAIVPDKKLKQGTEQYEACADKFAALVVENGITGIVLSQQNSEKAKGKPGEGGTTGAKGGEALPANCDFVLETDYDKEEGPDLLRVYMTRSRYSETGEIDYQINKQSGLILNAKAIS